MNKKRLRTQRRHPGLKFVDENPELIRAKFRAARINSIYGETE